MIQTGRETKDCKCIFHAYNGNIRLFQSLYISNLKKDCLFTFTLYFKCI